MEFQDASWHVDEVFAALRDAGAAIVTHGPRRPRAADDPADGPVPVPAAAARRLRADELAAWLDRLEPFLADGVDAFVYFRHDEVGRGAELALELAALAPTRAWPASRRRRGVRR